MMTNEQLEEMDAILIEILENNDDLYAYWMCERDFIYYDREI